MLDVLQTEFSNHEGPDTIILLVRLCGTAVFCGIIGFEREIQQNTAGLRTNILVGLASAAFALATLIMLDSAISREPSVKTDPLRLIEAVTSGVAFLAAGLVVFSRGKVHGLTTGASLWMSAAIGLSVGLGYWILALLTTATGFFVLTVLQQFKKIVPVKGKE